MPLSAGVNVHENSVKKLLRHIGTNYAKRMAPSDRVMLFYTSPELKTLSH